MAKSTAVFDLTLPLPGSETPAYRWLYEALRSEILAGRLGTGARLPATRDLARQYQLSRGTIVNAFELLKSEGYLEGSIGSGTYVSKVLPDELLHVDRGRPRTGDRDLPGQRVQQRRVSGYAERVRPFQDFPPRPIRAFRANIPAVDLFPANLWVQIAARRWRQLHQIFFWVAIRWVTCHCEKQSPIT